MEGLPEVVDRGWEPELEGIQIMEYVPIILELALDWLLIINVLHPEGLSWHSLS